MTDGHPHPLPTTCHARLHATGAAEAAGLVVGHPAPLHARTRRDGDRLDVLIYLASWTVGTGVLVVDEAADPPTWRGTVTIAGCEWACTSRLGSGLFTFSDTAVPR